MACLAQWLLAAFFARACGSPHEDFQSRVVIQKAVQGYTARSQERRLQEASACEEVHAAGTWGQMRIGYEMLNVENVSPDLLALVKDVLMARAVAYWSSVLQVRQAQQPLRMERIGTGCFKYAFDTDWRCSGMQSPMCGSLTVPDKYLRAKRTCQETCGPRCTGNCLQGGSCACDVDEWLLQQDSYCCYLTPQNGCPSSCSLSTAEKVGNGTAGGFVCEGSCLEAPDGEGAVGEDLHVFVTVENSADCQSSDTLLAYAISCGTDQCDRPTFGSINFCPLRLSTLPDDLNGEISTAVHELAHILVFSNEHFRNFRANDGAPIIPRTPDDARLFQNEVRYSCNSQSFLWNYANGNRRYVDISPDILDSFQERGYECKCPIGSPDVEPGCFYPAGPDFLQMPSCVVRLKTPTVLREVRDFFDCPTLGGAELENQEGNGCNIINSHWESRVFTAELMAPASSEHLLETYVSRVSLAVFQDSGWYNANLSAADPLVRGVHWGYKQGCNFAMAKCVDAGTPVSHLFCSSSADVSCSLDRRSVLGCGIQSASAVPPVYQYTPDNGLGFSASADYCPHYAIRYNNRVCANPESITLPYTNVNFMREVFSASSRCFMSTLHKDVAVAGGAYVADSSDFASERPTCYEVVCDSNGQSYEIKIADGSSTSSLGICQADGQTLTLAGAGGRVICASPAQVCSDLTPVHVLGDRWKDPRGTASTATTTSESSTTTQSTTTESSGDVDVSGTSTSESGDSGTQSSTTSPGASDTSASTTPSSTTSRELLTTSTQELRVSATEQENEVAWAKSANNCLWALVLPVSVFMR
mmetsp:Transcript_6307/g.14373  ORF Transcript_6307/g.14373 Transcript_6307/m.14373 type:complete len:815 (+) Transcript_6307:34-2478(+)